MLPGLSERKVVVMGTRRQQVPEAGISTARVFAIMMQRSVSHDWGGGLRVLCGDSLGTAWTGQLWRPQ